MLSFIIHKKRILSLVLLIMSLIICFFLLIYTNLGRTNKKNICLEQTNNNEIDTTNVSNNDVSNNKINEAEEKINNSLQKSEKNVKSKEKSIDISKTSVKKTTNNKKSIVKTNVSKSETSKNKNTTESKKYNNNDYVGMIKINGIKLNEPVFQAKDNDYYLTHNEYKKKDKLGAIYLDYRFSFENSKKKIIYGHSFVNEDTPFKTLENYNDKSYYNKHKYIYLKNNNINQKYEIFSVYVETNDWYYMQEPSEEKEEWLEELKKMKKKSLYNTNVNVNENDEILILQTCCTLKKYKKYEDKYFLVIAKKV